MKTYRVRYEKDEAGYWVATVQGVPGCHTQARSLETARDRVREALSVCVDDADGAMLVDSFHLEAEFVLGFAKRAMAAHSRAEKLSDAAQAMLSEAVQMLMEVDLSQRDAAVVLGLSHQRVAQLMQSKARHANSTDKNGHRASGRARRRA